MKLRTKNGRTIGSRVIANLAFIVAISVAIAMVSANTIRQLSKDLNSLATDSMPGIQALTAVQSIGLELRGTSLLLGTPGLTEAYRNQQVDHLAALANEMHSDLRKYQTAVAPEERALFDKSVVETEALIASCQKFQQLALHGEPGQAGAFWSANGSARSKAFRKAIQDEVDFTKSLANQTLSHGVARATAGTQISFALLAFSIVSGAFLCWWVVRSISRSLREVAEGIRAGASQVTNASEQVAHASQRLAESSSQQAAAVEQTSASGHEISSITRANSEHCQTAVGLMAETENLVNLTDQRLTQTVASMRAITDSSDRISKIIKVIDEIAFQTNILALNAAVEAARAGEAGLGFAVVADEVRNLAGRCQTAAKDISGLIQESVELAQAGRGRLNESASSVTEMSKSAMKVKTLIVQINEQARQQNEGMSQISRALVQMEQATQQNASTAEQSAAASTQMSSQANSMQDIIATLEQLIG